MKSRYLIFFFFLVVINSQAQITGIITDSKTKKPLAQVEVFIQGKTPQTITNETGEFALDAIRPGFADLVLFKNGYQLFKSSIHIQEGKAYAVNLAMDPAVKQKGPKALKMHEGEFLKFKETLIGRDFEGISILNAEAVSFAKSDQGTTIKCLEPLLIDNNTLGYHIRYYLQNGLEKEEKTTLQGYFTFQPMQAPGSDQLLRWTANRLKAYQGSIRHLFKSMVEGKAEQEGFEFFNKKGKLNPTDLISPSIKNYYKIQLNDTLRVQYKTSTGEIESTLLTARVPLQVNEDGILLIPQNLQLTGSMNKGGLASLLPQDFIPVKPAKEDLKRFYEKIYVHTDKPYYYPGEMVWFKGYMNYGDPSWRDSLSQVVYVELVHPKKIIAFSKKLRIDSGFFHGDFLMPDTLSPGTYYLRAYTSLSRNFGDENVFIKPVPVLNITDKADPSQGLFTDTNDNPLVIVSDKHKYKPRENIRLTLKLKNGDGQPLASNLSISVTDAEQVVPEAEAVPIVEALPIEKELNIENMVFKYPVEFGFGFSGKFLNNAGKPEKSTLTILQLKPHNMMLAETNEEGLFWQTGLQFYDTASFSFKSDKAKEKPYGKVELLTNVPALDFKESSYHIDIFKTESPQRTFTKYEVPKDAKLLKAVEVKATRIHEKGYKSTYGYPDVIIKENSIKTAYGNLLYSLVGRVAGLYVDPATYIVVFTRAANQSIANGSGPLVTINDAPMFGSAGDILSMINPSTVASIEITKRVNVLYGSQGANGVIAVFTKQGVSETESIKTPTNFQVIKIQGYSHPRNFYSPDYSDPKTDQSQADYRATIYWNPEVVTDVKTGTATLSFFAADTPGRYRVVGEGVTQNGVPVRCVYFIEVDND